VLARKEFQCILAMRVLSAGAKWEETAKLPSYDEVYAQLKTSPIEIVPIVDKSNPGPAAKRFSASYRRAYQMHGAIGPSCGVAVYDGDRLKVWSHNQGVFPLRQAIAQLVKLPEDKVQCVHVEGSGCYGHNGSDDASADAALIAFHMPGTPIRLQWMRDDEHKWEPYGAAMTSDISATLDDSGTITDWNYDVWSTTHGTRPGGARALIAGWHKAEPFPPPALRTPNPRESDGNRNSTPPYKLSSLRVMHHFVKTMPLRASSMRTLGAYFNVFCVETFLDELAGAAGVDPVEFRLRNLTDPRAKDVVKLAAEKFGWSSAPLPRGRGRGFGYARYKNAQTYVAVAVELSVDRDLGDIQLHRIVAACDSGQAVNPDGIKNQIEGGLLQSASWTLYEQVSHNDRRITSRDWSTYPIMRFSGVPEVVEVHLIDRPDKPFLGAGEASTGPISGAIGNAVASATGVRLRDLPLTPDRIRAAMGA
jgi:CO/xanthine dehydrogenase Mo-binding subunit